MKTGLTLFFLTAFAWGADLARLAEQLDKAAAREPEELGVATRLRAAALLNADHPELAKPLLDTSLRILGRRETVLEQDILAPLQQLAPGRPVPKSAPGPENSKATVIPAMREIDQRMRNFRTLPDLQRRALMTELAGQVRALPPSVPKLGLALNMTNLVTEGDLGPAVSAVAGTLAAAIQEMHPIFLKQGRGWPYGSDYLRLARLVRYERVPAPMRDPSLDAALAFLALQEGVQESNQFTLSDLDGVSWSKQALRGKIVVLNFWATWCPPCRKEMPDLDKLQKRFADQGLVILAVSDEEKGKVEGYVKKTGYSLHFLLDPGGKVKDAYGVYGIPSTFVFDRQGRLAAQSIDMRTEAQFLKLLEKAGLKAN